jgi:hypothetical protein
MKQLLLALGALAFAAGCSSSSSSTTSSGSTGATTATTTATTGTTSSTTTTTAASSSGSTGRNTVGSTSGSAASSGSTGGSTGSAGSSTSTSTSSGSSGSTGASGSTGTVRCDGPGVPNDACTGSIALALDTPVTGDTTSARNNFSIDASATGCASQLANDLTYTFTAPATAPFEFTVTPPTPTDGGSGTLDAVIEVVATCSAGVQSTCLGGSDLTVAGSPETVVVNLTQGQTVTVIVGAYDCSSNGPFALAVHQNPFVPTNDLCTSAAALTSVDGGFFTASGDTTSANDDVVGSCGGSPGGDVFYAFTVSQPSLFTATVTPTGASAASDGGGYYPVVYVRDGCDPTDGGNGAIEEGCNLASTAGLSASLEIPRLAPGNYIAVVDGMSTGGTFDLVLTLGTPPPVPSNDTCSAPTQITLTAQADGGFTGSAAFTTIGASDDYQPADGGSCFPYVSGPDVTFHATLPTATAPFTVSYLYPDGGTDTGLVNLIARATPCETGPELICGSGPTSGTATSADLYILVDDLRGGPYAEGTLLVTSP